MTYAMYMGGGIFPNGSFWISGRIYCPLSDGLDPDLANMEINGAVSALCRWEGEGTFVRQKTRAGLPVCAAGKIGENLDWCGSPSTFLFISLHSLLTCPPPCSVMWFQLQAWRGPCKEKLAAEFWVLLWQPSLFFVGLSEHQSHKIYPGLLLIPGTSNDPSHEHCEIKKQSPIPNQINSKWSQLSATCPHTLQGCL